MNYLSVRNILLLLLLSVAFSVYGSDVDVNIPLDSAHIHNDTDSIYNSIQLSNVTVKGASKKIEDYGSKIVYNVYLDKVTSVSTSADLLRKAPMVTVDINNNVSIKGNSSVKVLIDGRDMGLIPTSQILEQIPPENVKKIEVITAPGAKYDAQGSGGVINIITQKKMIFKSSGYLDVGLGTKGSHIMCGLNYSLTDKLVLSNTLYGLFGYSKTKMTDNLQNDIDGRSNGNLYSYNLGLTKDNKNGHFALTFQYIHQNMGNNETISQMDESKYNSGYNYGNADVNYCLKLGDIAKMNISNDFFLLSSFNTHEVNATNMQMGHNIFNNTSQMDWTITPGINCDIMVGAKYRNSFLNNRFGNTVLNRMSDVSAYLECNYRLSSIFSIDAGLRYEDYYLFYDKNQKQYEDLFYSGGLNAKITSEVTLSLHYNKRIDRPYYSSLLDEKSYQGANVMTLGNTSVSPSYSHMLEGGISFFVDKCYFKFSPYYSHANKSMSKFMKFDDGYLLQYMWNLDHTDEFGCSLWSTLDLIKGKLKYNGGFDYAHKYLYSLDGIKKDGNIWTLSVNTTYQIMPTLFINCFGSWSGRKIYLQGSENSYLYSNISIQKCWNDDHMRFALSLDNPFSNGVKINRSYVVDELAYNSVIRYYNRGVRLFFIYKFGKYNNTEKIEVKQNILNSY